MSNSTSVAAKDVCQYDKCASGAAHRAAPPREKGQPISWPIIPMNGIYSPKTAIRMTTVKRVSVHVRAFVI